MDQLVGLGDREPLRLPRSFAMDAEQGEPQLPRGCTAKAEVSASDRGLEIEDMKRLLCRAQVKFGGASALSSALEVPGQDHGIAFSALLEPLAGAAVREPLIVGG
ncbi:MAG TPA: hypothetical protein VF516_10145, partial [Kofleriaceae bacterium]